MRGIPMEFVYSNGAAPVPPSPPSTVIKSGLIPVSIIALHKAIKSLRCPIHNLNPTGFQLDNVRNF